ncbi:ATP-binding cassette subfamily C member 4 [Anabrus simplex]|uniref:ATP-binding cassette subfamily C member 4 n=1 Tax=Anabrus simplex TaxID=316456 RepID=UPI0035A2C230
MDAEKRESRPNPRQTANPLSALFFCWTIDLFREGYSKDLTVEDLYRPLTDDTSKVLGDKLERQWERQVEQAQKRNKKPSLRSALLRAFAWEYGKLGFIVFVSEIVIRLGQPLLLGQLLAYFQPTSTMDKSDALMYAGGIVLFTAVNTLLMNHFMLGAFHSGMRVRAACCSLIYRKSLRLSRTALGETAAGQVVNLLSNDVSRFDLVSVFIHYLWSSPVIAVIIAYLMWVEIGWPAFVGIAAVFVVVPLQAYTGKLSAIFRRKTAFKTDKRVRLMDEILSGIQVIKMYAWEKPFSKLVILARRAEIQMVTKTSYIRGIYMMFHMCTTRIALFATLITMAITEQPLQVNKVFVSLSYFNIISMTMSQMFVRGIAEVAEALVSVKRLQDFMLHDEFCSSQSPLEAYWKPTTPPTSADEKHASNGSVAKPEKKEKAAEGAMVELQKVTAKWDPDATDDTLTGVDIKVPKGKLVIVIGHVGAGKSSLLQAILGELTLTSGSCTVRGKVSYACQEPWVFAATVRQNIIFGRPFDRRRYNEVVRVCALQRDFEQFPRGDMTVVGERGTSLSGGQKARINLARAVYNDADIYLLDDPLSAVDTHVGKHLLEECINVYLGNKTRILVTHQLQFLSEADHIVILNNGAVEMQGSFQELASKVDYAELMGIQEGTESNDGSSSEQPEEDRHQSPIHNMLRQISERSRSSSRDLRDIEESAEAKNAAAEMAEASSKGKTGGKSVYLEYFRAGANFFMITIMAILFALAQAAASGSDYFVSYWISIEEMRNRTSLNVVNETELAEEVNDTTTLKPMLLDEKELDFEMLSTDTYVYMYTAIIVALFVFAVTRSFTFYKVCMRSSERLHHLLFHSIIRTRMRFFDTNPSGRILNRFSKDIGSIDELLPKALLDASQVFFLMIGCLILALIVNYLLVLPLLVLSVIFWFDRRVFLKTSKNIKRVEGITKSPVFTHLHATLQGLTTIRAYGAQDILKDEFDKHQDLHSSAWYMFITTSTAFGFSLDILSLIYIACVTFSFLVFEGALGGEVGLAITQSMALTGMIQWGMRQSAEVANQMMAVERILEYAALEPEPNLESPPAKKPPKDWPSLGEIRFTNVFLKYSPTDHPVLKDLNIVIRAREKIGIVGRTGAGKSSLIAALFRLAWIEGDIVIDGINTKDIALQELRSKISIIPQDPVLFSGTMRKNLDPFEEYPDNLLWEAIGEVELKDALHESHGLQSRVAEQGSNFSVGQRQLVCLARAIIRNNKILMLDEATANVDPHTDGLIQTTIRRKFKDCTVLTVAHRLNTIMDSDKVLVMDSGRMVEFDHPHMLLKNSDSYFSKMVQDTGKNMAEQLARVAEESYKSLHS